MEWEDVLKRKDIIGGDIETQEDGVIFRGPISNIQIEGDQIVIDAEWIAVFENGAWEKSKITQLTVPAQIKPNCIGDGRIVFCLVGIGMATIFPEGGSKLDPSKVKGL